MNKEITQAKVCCATCCALCCVLGKQHIITAEIMFSCHNNYFFINDAPLLKVVAFNVVIFDAVIFDIGLYYSP